MPRREEKPERVRLENARPKKLSLFPKSAKLKRPSDPKEARAWLRGVANHLSNFPNAGPPFRFVAYAIKQYLRAPENRSLQHELELINPVGTPGSFQSRMKERVRGRQVVTLRDAGKSWPDICDAVGLQNKQSVKKIYAKYSVLLPKEQQQARIDRKMKAFFREHSENRH